MSADEIDQPAGNEERRDAARPLFVQGDRGVVDAAEAADAGADQHAGLDLLLVGLGRPVGVVERLGRGGARVDDEIVDLALLLGLHPVVGIEGVGRVAARHLRGDLAGEVGDVEILDPGRAPIRRPAGAATSPRRRRPAASPCPSPVTTTRLMRSILCPVRWRSSPAPPTEAQRDKGRTERRPSGHDAT